MELKEAIQGFSEHRFYCLCGYKYRCLSHGGHGELPFRELPERMQIGVLEMINGMYRSQKMVYDYDLDFVNHQLKAWGLKLGQFYEGCGINKTFWMNRSLRYDREYRLMVIRLHLLIIINRLFRYVLE